MFRYFLLACVVCSSSNLSVAASRVADKSTPLFGKKLLREDKPSTSCEKPCTREFHPHCASDGFVYDNKCLFEIAQCNDPTLKLESHGEFCVSATPTNPDPCELVCDLLFDPVCGSDGIMHPNSCAFEIYKCKQAIVAEPPVELLPLEFCGWQRIEPTPSSPPLVNGFSAGDTVNGVVGGVQGVQGVVQGMQGGAFQGVQGMVQGVQGAVQNAQGTVQGVQGAYETLKNAMGEELLNKTKAAISDNFKGDAFLQSGALLSVVMDDLLNGPALRIKPLSAQEVGVLEGGEAPSGDTITIPLSDGEDPNSSSGEEPWSAVVSSLQSSLGGFRKSWGEFKRPRPAERLQACPPGCVKWTDGCTTCDCNPEGGVKECDEVECVWQGMPKCLEYVEENIV